MKNSKNWFLLAALALTTGFSFAQKAVETSAAVEYKNNFQGAFMQQDMEKAKSSLTKAKAFIDEAAVHPDTKERFDRYGSNCDVQCKTVQRGNGCLRFPGAIVYCNQQNRYNGDLLCRDLC